MPKITSREQLLNALAEASELEHNLLCIYLFASFSLKESIDENISAEELSYIDSWKKVIREIAIQEMGHFAIVSNLLTSVGGSAHVNRPNFPITPGYYPNNFVMNLRPFDLETLDHFIFLERPVEEETIKDPLISKEAAYAPKRETPTDRLMTFTGNYKTVGEIYKSIEEGIIFLSEELGEKELFCGSTNNQLGQAETRMDNLLLISGKDDALKSIKHIVEQGEGGDCEDCHFKKFLTIKKEYEMLLKANAHFSPARNTTSDPVMRRNSENENTTWIHHPKAANILDCSNALYNLMLRFLAQLYTNPSRTVEDKKLMIKCTFIIMKHMGVISKKLTTIPVSHDNPHLMSGMTFTVDRYVNTINPNTEKRLLRERLHEILKIIQNIPELDESYKELKELVKFL